MKNWKEERNIGNTRRYYSKDINVMSDKRIVGLEVQFLVNIIFEMLKIEKEEKITNVLQE